jgi:heat shock protein HtpX
MVLRMYRAQPLLPQQAPELFALFGDLARKAELAHTPALYYVPTRMLNAFAVGANRSAAVAVTDGLLRVMTPRELAGILAHELSHIRFQDTRLMALGDVFSRLTVTMSQIGQFLLVLSLPAVLIGARGIPFLGLLVLVFAPMASTLLQLALSRTREFHADAGAIELTSDPLGLAAALAKLERTHSGSLWQRIFVPYRVQEPTILRTHPATQQRIERLMKLAEASSDEIPLPDTTAARHFTPHGMERIRGGPRWHVSGLRY